MGDLAATLHHNTPAITAFDSRGLAVREIAIHRHPDALEVTTSRITRHCYGPGGFLSRSADPRLNATARASFTYATDLSGRTLCTRSADAGTVVSLHDTAGRRCLAWSNIRITDDDGDDLSQAVTRAWRYEDSSLPGRVLSVSEGGIEDPGRVVERFVYAAPTSAHKALNLAGQCVRHYDPAGLFSVASLGLCGVPLAIARRLLDGADDPDTLPDWEGEPWHARLEEGLDDYLTLTCVDATGAVLATTDAAGNRQRTAYDVVGAVKSRWLSGRESGERATLVSQTHSAAGQVLHEEHGNGVRVSYTYEEQTQRLTGIRVARPAGHAAGAGVLLDLEHAYDPAGNLLVVTNHAEQERYWRNQRVAAKTTCVYDSLCQLVNVSGREMAGVSRQAAIPQADDATYTNYSRSYLYDAGGNLRSIRHSSPQTGNDYTLEHTLSERSCRGVSSALASDPAQVEALFTPAGQQRLLQPGQALSWTLRGELRKASLGSGEDHEHYRYDAAGQRVLKGTVQVGQVQRVLYLPGLELRSVTAAGVERQRLEVVRPAPAGRTEVRLLHWASGKPADIANDALRYSYADLIGSSLLELDEAGRVISQEEYYPYGGTALWKVHGAETDIKTIRYSGKERDLTGLYYYGFRYYQPWGGRWLSADPAGTVDGLNLFRMVGNNPLGYRDGNGLMMQAPQAVSARVVKARGLPAFERQQREQVLQSFELATATLGLATHEAVLSGPLMSAFFGVEYSTRTPEILDRWARTDAMLAEYSSPYPGHGKFLKVLEPGNPSLATVDLADFEGKVWLHERFFQPVTSDQVRSVTLIHELSHLRRASGVRAVGPNALDFFYLRDSDPVNDSIDIVENGNLTLPRLVDGLNFMSEIARFNQWTLGSVNESGMSYRDSGAEHSMTVGEAISTFNRNPQLRAMIAARNADSLAWAATAIAFQLRRV